MAFDYQFINIYLGLQFISKITRSLIMLKDVFTYLLRFSKKIKAPFIYLACIISVE